MKIKSIMFVAALGVSWVLLLTTLTIAPLWDEITAMEVVRQSPSLSTLIYHLWFEPIYSLYRPLATTLLALTLAALPFDIAWVALRLFNCALIIAAFALLSNAAQRLTPSHDRSPSNWLSVLYWAAIFLSPAVLIVANWYANIFDAMCFMLIAGGVALVVRDRMILAGLAFGAAWFCKEAALFVGPLLVYLYLLQPQRRKALLRTAIIYVILGVIYWWLRSKAVSLGSARDIHPVTISGIWPAFQGYIIRLWMPGFTPLPAWAGLVLTLGIMICSRNKLFVLLLFMIGAGAAVAYTGMVGGDKLGLEHPLISHVIFSPRLFYIPAGLLLFALLVSGRRLPLCLAVLGMASSLPFQYMRQHDIQTAYATYYQLGEQAAAGIQIYARESDGVQGAPLYRGVRIGGLPDATYTLNPVDGTLQPRGSSK